MRVLSKQTLGRLVPALLTSVVIAGALFVVPAGAIPSSTTTISGTVTVAAGGAPVAGLCVLANPTIGSAAESSATTASDGTYTIEGLAPGSYDVQFYAGTAECSDGNNYVSQWYNGTPSGASSETSAVAVAVTVASPASDINAALSPGATISGTITEANGVTGLANACVYAENDSTDNSAITASDGSYTIDGLPAGSYNLEIDPTCDGATTSSYEIIITNTPTVVTSQQALGGQNFALVEGGTISGTIISASSPGGVGGVCVWADQTLTGEGLGLATTTSDGEYSMSNMAPGSYNIELDPTCLGNTSSPYAIQLLSTTPTVTGGATTTLNATLLEAGALTDEITPSTPPTSETVGGTYSPSATATSGDAVAITLDGSSTGCTLASGVVNFTAAGTCLIDFNDPTYPNSPYASAVQVQQSIAVSAPPSGGGGSGGGGGGGTTTGPSVAPPPAGLPTSAYGAPTTQTTSSTSPTSVTVTSGGATADITVPTGALPSGTVVSAYPITNSSSLLTQVPTGQSYVLSLAVSWVTASGSSPVSTSPITMTITDPSIVAGDTIYELTSTGLTAVGSATANGSATVTFSADPTFLVTSSTAPPSLTVTTVSGKVGKALTLSTSGEAATGSVTYKVTNGTATGCEIKGDRLTATSVGTCLVTAVQGALTSTTTKVTFSLPARPAPLSVGFSSNQLVLSSAQRRTLNVLAKSLLAGATVSITGYAKGNTALARGRATAAASYLEKIVKVHLVLKTSTTSAASKDLIVTVKQ